MNKRQKYGIRKYKMGAASIALGTVIVIGMSDTDEAQAAEKSNIELTNKSGEMNSSHNTELQEQTVENSVNNTNVTVANNTQNLSHTLKNYEKPVVSNEKDSNNTVVKPRAFVSNSIKPNEVVAPIAISTGSYDKVDKINNHGNDVTHKVNVTESSITGQDGKSTINPHNAERVTLKYKWKFENGIKAGDYFDFTISENVDTNGISAKRKMPEIKANDQIVANGEVLKDGKLRYTFTNYVESKIELEAELSMNLFFKPSIVKNNGKEKVSSKLGNHIINREFMVNYLNGVKDKNGMVIIGRIDSLDKDINRFSHTAIINPDKKNMSSVTISGTFVNGELSTDKYADVKIFKYKGTDKLPQSVYIDLKKNDFEDVTGLLNPLVEYNGSYIINLDNLNNTTYIIKYDGSYNNASTNLTFRTQLQGFYNSYGYSSSFLTWDNGVQFYSNTASGSGKDKPIAPLIENGQKIDFNIDSYTPEIHQSDEPYQYESEDSRPVYTRAESGSDVGDSNYQTIEETEDTIHVDTDYVSHINTNHNADVVEIEEDSNPGGGSTHHTSNVVEFDEDSATGVVTGAISDHIIVEDTMEYITENNLIELEDDHTLPPHITGQAEGSIEEIEENSVIDINDFTMIDGDHGELTEVLEETDENHYIDINEYTMTEGSHGQATGIIEETEEYQHADILEMTTPIGENGATQGIIEEVEDSNLIEFDEETGNGAISGHVIGAVEEIEDSFYISTLSESGIEQGSNGSDTFVEDTSEDKPSVKTNSPDPIEIVEEIPRENGYTKGIIIEEDTKPPHFASPNMPKEEPQETQNQPKVNSPMDENNVDPKPTPKDKTIKVIEKVRAKSPKIHEEVMPKVKTETPSSNSIVSNKPNFAPVSSMPVKLKSNKKVTQNQQQHVKQKALPDTGNTSDKNLILMGGLISLLGFSIMRRKKVKQ
ncbi:fibrinogen-binding adhesin SdrG C-terminal domain-containing protein [Staphylococcus hyicus]|uniref:Fibrinogen-binding adhesin SdrG C-terminal domain-containing protein n=2 Tax=Staphylococcus hyicus TaxID=1284 RepID=A0ACD5FMY5_STAHY|nr:fibrinogen-binding adhesin SdrG C-terminal domain-containing protein [Staphylococcus hyicus]MDP4461246.1 fibrinogen-binding adhesin SdrG C-terminal domain-containing protein [Staphylococcus hyicus]MDP4462711.1 fibrinogen-binding adhesin SdrG C-terminal domain-containing protein [Staphylococcus hyicus]